jgi:hypothetical protein
MKVRRHAPKEKGRPWLGQRRGWVSVPMNVTAHVCNIPMLAVAVALAFALSFCSLWRSCVCSGLSGWLYLSLSRSLFVSLSRCPLPSYPRFSSSPGGQHSMYTAWCLYRSLPSMSEFFFSGQNLVTQLHRRCHFFLYTRAQQFHAMWTRDNPLCRLEK